MDINETDIDEVDLIIFFSQSNRYLYYKFIQKNEAVFVVVLPTSSWMSISMHGFHI